MAERTVSVKLKADVAQYMASMRAAGRATSDLEKAGLDLQAALSNEADAAGKVTVAQARLNDLRASGKASALQLAQAEDQLASAHMRLGDAQDRTRIASERFVAAQREIGIQAGEGLGDGVTEGYRRGAAGVERETEKVARRVNAQFQALKFGVYFAGMPSAAAVAGAGTVAALGVVPVAAVAIGAALLRSNTEVAQSYRNLWEDVKSAGSAAAQPLADDFVASGQKITRTVNDLRPQLNTVFAESQNDVGMLADGVDRLATNSMPGLVIAAQNSDAVMRGTANTMADLGGGVTEFFTNVSAGSESAGHNIETFGKIGRDALGFVGSLLATLSNEGAPALDEFRSTLLVAEDTILDVAQNGLPLATAAASGFGSTVSGLLTVIGGASSLLGSWASPLASTVGTLKAIDMITFGGISRGFDGLGDRVRNTEGATNKFKVAGMGLMAGALNPLTLVAGLAGFALHELGERQQQAAQRAAEHKEGVNDLVAALQREGNIMGAITAGTNDKALADQNAQGNALALGIAWNTVRDAAQGNAGAMGDLRTATQGTIESTLRAAGASQEQISYLTMMNDHLLKAGGSYATVQGQMELFGFGLDDLSVSQRDAIIATLNLSGAAGEQAVRMREAQKASHDQATAAAQVQYSQSLAEASASSLGEAYATLADATQDVTDRATAMKRILDELSGRQPDLEESTQRLNDGLRDLAEQFDGVETHSKGFGSALVNADGTINTVTENGSKLQNLLNTASEDMIAFGQATYDGLIRNGVPANEALAQTNAKLGEQSVRWRDTLKAAGLNEAQINSVLAAYHLLPADIVTQLSMSGDVAALSKLGALQMKLQDLGQGQSIVVDGTEVEGVQGQLNQLGYALTTLPDGRVQITADPSEAAKQVAEAKKVTENAVWVAKVFADPGSAIKTVSDWREWANDVRGVGTFLTNPKPANDLTTGWQRWANTVGAVGTFFTNTGPATSGVWGWTGFANNARGTGTLFSNIDPAVNRWNGWQPKDKYANVYLTTIGGGLGLAKGGPVPGFASGGGIPGYPIGGRVAGPGGPTTDSILAWLSNGEHVWTAREVAAAGGHAAVEQMRNAVLSGTIPMYATGGATSLEVQAAQEMLAAIAKGKNFYEDFSFKGMSDNADAWQEALADKFYAANPGIDYGTWQSRTAVEKFLRDTVASASVQASVRNGRAVAQIPSRISAGNVTTFQFSFPNYVGNTNDLVRTLRAAVANAGGNVQTVLGRR